MVRSSLINTVPTELILSQGTTEQKQPTGQTSKTIDMSGDVNACLRSLNFAGMGDRSLDIDTATHSTCEWIYQHPSYQKWLNSGDHRLLWVKGIPGSGKSTLVKSMLKAAENTLEGKQDRILLHFFFHGRGNELQQSPAGFYRSLCHQLLSDKGHPEALSELVNDFREKSRKLGNPGSEWQWHVKELAERFKTALAKIPTTKSIWLFVDALDECGKEEAIQLIDYVKDLIGT